MRDRESFLRQLRQETFVFDKNASHITPAAKAKLPVGYHVLAIVLSKDIDNLEYEAILVSFPSQGGSRVAHFRLSDGSYVDDYMM